MRPCCSCRRPSPRRASPWRGRACSRLRPCLGRRRHAPWLRPGLHHVGPRSFPLACGQMLVSRKQSNGSGFDHIRIFNPHGSRFKFKLKSWSDPNSPTQIDHSQIKNTREKTYSKDAYFSRGSDSDPRFYTVSDPYRQIYADPQHSE